jgi:hypothetical protein
VCLPTGDATPRSLSDTVAAVYREETSIRRSRLSTLPWLKDYVLARCDPSRVLQADEEPLQRRVRATLDDQYVAACSHIPSSILRIRERSTYFFRQDFSVQRTLEGALTKWTLVALLEIAPKSRIQSHGGLDRCLLPKKTCVQILFGVNPVDRRISCLAYSSSVLCRPDSFSVY